MGRKGKKTIPQKPNSGLTVGEMWRQTRGASESNLAALHGGCSDFSEELSQEEEEGYSQPLKPPQKAKQSVMGTDTELITTAVLKALLADLKRSIHKDVTALRAGLKGLTGRISKLEGSSQSQAQNVTALQHTVQTLQQQTQQYEHRLAVLEDAR
ncbi:Hypothetical predicted protein [Pelobates cultripes]|uniref:Uncharacterized protein n=1 Tax=Pelobates cultripes TaxID=61616 RepID=A0AAD1RVQ6_PELCU|nr:Hypothetical predicted protein [Pelobates cultripes]